MKYTFKLNKSEFYNGTIHCFISFLLVSLCIFNTGCMTSLSPPSTHRVRVSFEAGIQPLPENHGTWSKQEVDSIMETIATVAQHHGLKQGEDSDYYNWYTLTPFKNYLRITACFRYALEIFYPSGSSITVFRGSSITKKDIKGTILVGIELLSAQQLTLSEREQMENVWDGLCKLLQDKFGDRMHRGKDIKIYELKP